jgi:alpha-tubulin suppressor-like RCC1 family protein
VTLLGFLFFPLATLATAGCDGEEVSGPEEPTQLTFTVQPMSVGSSDPIVPSIAVVVRDRKDQTVWDWTETVTLTLESDQGPVTLTGTTSVTPVGGTAIFDDIRVGDTGQDFRLRATSMDLSEAESQPFSVYGPFRSSILSAGRYHTCSLDAEGRVACWGDNAQGQLGVEGLSESGLPVPLETELRFTTLSAGSYHTCGLTLDGEAYCWGGSELGELGTPAQDMCATGYGGMVPCSSVPLRIEGGPWKQVEAGYGHTCGLTEGGEMYCWGYNDYGQVGNGSEATREPPTPVSGDHRFSQMSVGYLHSCGLTAEGTALCWGSNIYGEVGDSTHTRRTEPTPVHGDLTFVSIDAGGGPCHGHTCGITPKGVTLCWGRNYQRGLEPFYGVLLYAPVPLREDPGLEAISIGGYAICGLRGDGALFCWGQGTYGTIGHGEPGDRQVPTAIRPDLRFSSVTGGHFHTCAVTLEGDSYCWGRNAHGQLGNQSSPLGWTRPVTVWGF